MTIKDIARESGYAVSTVSRALNDHPDVSREAKEKIKAIVAAHKFVPNSNARQLKVQQNRSIIIVVKGAFNMFFAAILERMQSLISCSGYSAEVHYLDEDADEVLVGEQLQRERKPLGFIFLGGNTCSFEARFSAIAVPSVLATTLADHLNFGNLSSAVSYTHLDVYKRQEFSSIMRIGYTYRTDATESSTVQNRLKPFFALTITAAPPWNVLP